MIRSFVDGLVGALLSPRTLGPVLLIGAYAVLQVGRTADHPGRNAWDALIPAATDTTIVSMVGLSGWYLWVLPAISATGSELRLLRHGSRLRAFGYELCGLGGNLAALGVLLLPLLLAIGSPLGLAPSWSPLADSTNAESASAFSSAALARHFGSPWAAFAACAAYSAAAYLALAAAILAVAVSGHRRGAVIALTCIVLWAFVCSFSLLSPAPVVDASVVFSLAWALAVPGGMSSGLVWLVVSCACAVIWVARGRARVGGLGLLANRTGNLVAITVIAAFAASHAANDPADEVGVVRRLFAGAHGDPLGYALIAAIPLGFATRYAARLADTAEGRVFYEAQRRGSYRRWTACTLMRELPWLVLLAALVALTVVVVAAAAGRPLDPAGADAAALAVATLGILMLAALALTVVTTLLWLGATPWSAWPSVVGGVLVLGYATPPGLAAVNVAAPFSLNPGTDAWGTSAAAVVVTGILTVVLGAVAVRIATPARAETLG